MELQLFDCPQGSEDWVNARLGVVTASEFKSVMAKGEGKTRRKYLLTVAGEKCGGQPFDRYTNDFMDRGHAFEDEARRLYTFITDNEVRQVGFLRRGDVGYSPDGLVGDDGLLEVKTKLAHLHLECLLSDELPSEHRQQCQGGLWVSGRQWVDFVSYSTGLPLFVKRVHRDEAFIARIKVEVDSFLQDLHEIVGRVQNYKVAA